MGPAADEREDVATEQHLHDGDSPAVEVAAEDLAERVAVEDPKPSVGAGGEAAGVLVEGEVEEGGGVRRTRRRRRRRRGGRRRGGEGGFVFGFGFGFGAFGGGFGFGWPGLVTGFGFGVGEGGGIRVWGLGKRGGESGHGGWGEIGGILKRVEGKLGHPIEYERNLRGIEGEGILFCLSSQVSTQKKTEISNAPSSYDDHIEIQEISFKDAEGKVNLTGSALFI